MRHIEHGTGLLLTGGVGAGKSSTAGLICIAAAQHRYTVRWAHLGDLLTILRDTTNPERRRDELRQQYEADLVVWDDVGVTSLSSWEIGLCDQITEIRYSRKRSTIVTTNLTVEALTGDQALARMVSRWRQRNRAIHFTGRSMRQPDGGAIQYATEELPL